VGGLDGLGGMGGGMCIHAAIEAALSARGLERSQGLALRV
jgi:hypothetical protein